MDTTRDIERDRYYEEYRDCCGTCHYWTKDGKGHSCMCFDSPFAADWTDEDDGCNHYIIKRGI